MDCESRCDFAGSYEVASLPAVKALERSVLGCDYGGTSWTTVRQVQHIVSSLHLTPGRRLLELGCGSGWPGLYLSLITGCHATLLDMPLIALRLAGERAARDEMSDRVDLVNGSAANLPFAAGIFEAISHSDVLCCLPGKREMLRECRRVVRESGRMHFSVIQPAHDLDADDFARAIDLGPPCVEVHGRYSDLLRETGWRTVERVDVTAEYADTLARLVTGLEAGAGVLKDVLGDVAFADAVMRRSQQLEIVRAGILKRIVVVADAA
jgi:SAM-dependent methyltransferase